MEYLFYCFDEVGRQLPPEPLDAEDDATAIALVRLQLHKRCKIWAGAKLVFSLPEQVVG